MFLKKYIYFLLVLFSFGFFSDLSYSEILPADLPPENFFAISGEIQAVPLTWSMHPNTNTSGYVIYRSDSKGSDFKEIAKLPSKYTTSYLDGEDAAIGILKIPGMMDQSLLDNKSYYYKIATITGENTFGSFSKVVKAITAQRPTPPLNFRAFSGGARVVSLNWLPPNDKAVAGYIIYRRNSKDDELLLNKKISGRLVLSYIDKGTTDKPLENGYKYYYAISSFNQAKVESYITKIVSVKTKDVPLPITDIAASKGKVKVLK